MAVVVWYCISALICSIHMAPLVHTLRVQSGIETLQSHSIPCHHKRQRLSGADVAEANRSQPCRQACVKGASSVLRALATYLMAFNPTVLSGSAGRRARLSGNGWGHTEVLSWKSRLRHTATLRTSANHLMMGEGQQTRPDWRFWIPEEPYTDSDMWEPSLLRQALLDDPSNPGLHNALGAELLARGQTRAALRCYEAAQKLSASSEDDLGFDEGLEASANIALCIISCAEKSAMWRDRLADARLQLWRCLVSDPTDPRLLSLLERADAMEHTSTKDGDIVRQTIEDESDKMQQRGGAAIMRSWDLTTSDETAIMPNASETLMIAFAGADYWEKIPAHKFVKSFRRAGVTKAIFVRDVMRAWYTRGIGADGSSEPHRDQLETSEPDRTFEGMVRILQAEVTALQPTQVVTIGSSMGAYAAVRAGIALNADRAVAFSPQVFIDMESRHELGLPEMTFDDSLTILRAISTAASVPLPSLVDVVGQAPENCRTKLEVHAGSLSTGDMREANLLHEAVRTKAADGSNLSMTLTEHEGRHHNLVVNMRDTGELHDLLLRLMGPDADAIPRPPVDWQNIAKSAISDGLGGLGRLAFDKLPGR